ncbi:MAG: hypothetical protein R3B82_04715 [Sandaracinaceae bacterium]
MSTNCVIRILDVSHDDARLRVRVSRVHPDANLPFDPSFFVRMFGTLSLRLGGLPAVDAELAGRWLDEAFIDTNTWRFIAGYDEHPGDGGDDGVYDVRVVDRSWLRGIEPGLEIDSADYSTWADPVTVEDVARVPPLRIARRLDLTMPNIWDTVISPDGQWLAVVGSIPTEVAVFESKTWTRVWGRAGVQGCETCCLPDSEGLVTSIRGDAFALATGEPRDRDDALAGWAPEGDLAAWLWSDASADGARRVLVANQRAVLTDGTGAVLRELPPCRSASISADGRVVASIGSELVVEREGDAAPLVFSVREKQTMGVALSPDGAYALTIEGKHDHIYVRRTSDGEVVRYGIGWQDRGGTHVHLARWSKDGRFIALCHTGGSPRSSWVEVYELEGGTPPR